jgi:hypothetical protein
MAVIVAQYRTAPGPRATIRNTHPRPRTGPVGDQAPGSRATIRTLAALDDTATLRAARIAPEADVLALDRLRTGFVDGPLT